MITQRCLRQCGTATVLLLFLALATACRQRPADDTAGINPHPVRHWYPHVGLLYGPVQKIVETYDFGDGVRHPSVVYIFEDSIRQVHTYRNGVLTALYYYDTAYRPDSMVVITDGRRSATRYQPCNYQRTYFYTGAGGHPIRIAIDSAARTVTSFDAETVAAVDRFDGAGRLRGSTNNRAVSADTFIYNRLGHPALEEARFARPPGDFNRSVYAYRYDSPGNWTQRTSRFTTTNSSLNSRMVTNRHIVYR